jgi:hypothetical protein
MPHGRKTIQMSKLFFDGYYMEGVSEVERRKGQAPQVQEMRSEVYLQAAD